jgi:hypothetical protein
MTNGTWLVHGVEVPLWARCVRETANGGSDDCSILNRADSTWLEAGVGEYEEMEAVDVDDDGPVE